MVLLDNTNLIEAPEQLVTKVVTLHPEVEFNV